MGTRAARFVVSAAALLSAWWAVVPPAAAQETDPSRGRVVLPASGGWNAELVHDQGKVGVWVAKTGRVLTGIGSDELVTLDDEGKLRVHIPYSGRWIAVETIKDGAWLNGLAIADFDPRHAGPEIWSGGQKGNLWEFMPHPHGTIEARLVAHLPGEEIQTIVPGDLDPAAPGPEMLVFCWPGRIHVVRLRDGAPALETLGTPSGRVRDAILLPGPRDAAPEIVLVSRDGRADVVRLEGNVLKREQEIFVLPNGLARVALGRADASGSAVIYAVSDDGLVLRASRTTRGGAWEVETIFATEGLRGVAAGRFSDDPAAETVAVFGYGKKVEVLTRGARGWTAETIFEDRDKGHWLCTGEVDGRNATDELFVCGYGGRVVALSRPAGYGRPGLALSESGGARPIRVAVGAVRREMPFLTPHVYHGGFLTKTAVYETLVRIDREGRPEAALASSWERLDGGKRWAFTLRDGAKFHDGKPCDAKAVEDHFKTWLGKPEHDWLGMNRRVTAVRAADPRRVEFTLSEPYPLVLDLAAVNPCSVAAASAQKDAASFAAVGTGPFRVTRIDGERGVELAPAAGGRAVELRFIPGGDGMTQAHLRALEAGDVDVALDGWTPLLPRDDVQRLSGDARFRVLRAPGSRVVHIAFRRDGGPFADAAVRRRAAAAVDRAALAREAERGFAAPCETLFAPGFGGWPRGRILTPDAPAAGPPVEATLLVSAYAPDAVRTASVLARQLRERGFDIDLAVADAGEMRERRTSGRWDLEVAGTDGGPYDPHVWLTAHLESLPEIAGLVRASFAAADDAARAQAWRAVEEAVERDALVVPLHIPERVAVVRAGAAEFALGADAYHWGEVR